MENDTKINEVIDAYHEDEESTFDPLGSYTGNDEDPVQDGDDI